jgi:hypothetical protein
VYADKNSNVGEKGSNLCDGLRELDGETVEGDDDEKADL